MRLKPKVGPAVYSPAWWEQRQFSFGASEAAAVCGLSRWNQPLAVYESKCRRQDETDKATEEQRRGHRFESVVLDMYEEKVGGTIYTHPPMLIHPEHEFMSASPDALWTDEIKSAAIEKLGWSYALDYIPVDAKTTMHSGEFGEPGTDDIPQEYVMQAQQQMAVTDAKRCDLPVLFPNYQMRVYKVERCDSLIGLILDAEREMLERIRNQDPPPPNWSHPKTYELIRAVHGVTGESVHMSEQATLLWAENEELGKKINDLRHQVDLNKAKVLHEMGDAGIGHMTDGRQLIRKRIKREAREVKATEYTSLRCKKNF